MDNGLEAVLRTEDSDKKSVGLAGASVSIRTEDLPNSSHCTSQLVPSLTSKKEHTFDVEALGSPDGDYND
jgi:hypothetical protein